ncbi:MAG: class B sortase [Ruminococcaceae bacterium]|nr:class B sortase [Oscillospiraceae bacterium]
MSNNNRTYGWLIASALLAILAVGFLLYAVLHAVSSDANRRQNDVIRDIAYGTLAPETIAPAVTTTSAPDTTPAATTTSAPQTTPAATTTSAPDTTPAATTTSAPDTTPAATTTSAPQTTPAATTTSAPQTTPAATTTSAPQTTPAVTTTSAPETTPAVTTTVAQTTAAKPETTAAPSLSPLPEGFPPEADARIDFEALKKECADIYAWITVPGANVDLPILRHPTDNAYYLDHDLYGKESDAGAIFTESYNSKDFSDFITVVYGHSMRDGSMFAPLLEFRDRDFFDKHRHIIVHTEEKTLVYQIFAAYRWDDRHILLNYDFSGDLMRYSYISYVMSIRDMYSVIDTEADVDTDDKILTLSCCTYVDGNRFIVQGVLIGER